MINSSLFSSISCEWATPDDLYQVLHSEFHFDLDPCASDSNHKCDRYFTRSQNGLLQSWKGSTVFCNPPYGRCISKWVEKCYTEHLLHNITVVMLIPARTDTSYFHDFIYGKSEIRFLRGRLHFNGSKYNAPFPSMVVVFKKEDKK